MFRLPMKDRQGGFGMEGPKYQRGNLGGGKGEFRALGMSKLQGILN